MPDIDSITEIFIRLRSRLAAAVSRIVPPKEIEDIVQDTYVRVRQAESLSQIKHPESFMFRTARNLALDHVKRAESRLADSRDDMDSLFATHPEAQADDQTFRTVASDEEFASFCDAVRVLPEQCRRAFVLRKVYGFSQKEIAEMMSLSESTVEKHIVRGMKRTMLHSKSTGGLHRQSMKGTSRTIFGRDQGMKR